MPHPFFITALKAAKTSNEDFAALFATDGHLANIRENGDSGSPLIHALIREIDDDRLPAILAILINKGVDIESGDICPSLVPWLQPTNLIRRPLAQAASWGKKNALIFLIEHHAVIDAPDDAALCAAIESKALTPQVKLDIVKALGVRGAKLNIQNNKFDRQPLASAARVSSADVLAYLCSLGADLSLLSSNKVFQTVLHDYQRQINNMRFMGSMAKMMEIQEQAKLPKDCLDVLTQVAYKLLYQQAVHFKGARADLEAELLRNIMQLSAGYDEDTLRMAQNRRRISLQNHLREHLAYPILKRIDAEKAQRTAFCKGLMLYPVKLESKEEQKEDKNAGTAVHRLSQHRLFDSHVVTEIFSFMHEETPGLKAKR
jgi:hypothetical protein